MSSISSVGSSLASSYAVNSAASRPQRPDPAQMAEDLFSKLDTSGKGYVEQSDLESALSGMTKSTSSQQGAGASQIFGQLDGDGDADGKVTQDEMSSSFTKLAQALDGQFNQSRMQGGMPPPPPPPGGEKGFTKDELSSQLSAIGDSDSAQSSLMTDIVNNFDAADTNQDGEVSFQEAMAYDQAASTSASTSSAAGGTSSADGVKTDAQIFRQIVDLLRSYGNDDGSGQSGLSAAASLISTSA